MSVDVTTEIVISRPLANVADYAAHPSNAIHWYANICSVDWLTDKPLQVGSRIAFIATFLGRNLSYTYDVIEFEPGVRLIMQASEGPFEMETTYIWTATSASQTRMTLRNYGEPAGFFGLLSPALALAIKHATAKDLARLKRILEST